MALVTLTSDLGNRDFFVAALKGAIISHCTTFPQIIDVTHQVRAHDIKEAAYTISNAYAYFPKGTIHVVHISSSLSHGRMLLAEADGHYFITYDTGLLSLMFGTKPHKVFLINEELGENSTLLGEKTIAHVISLLQQEYLPKDFAQPFSDAVTYRLLQPVTNAGTIRGSVVYIDHFGNAVSNISRDMFERFMTNKRYSIFANVGNTNQISVRYDEVEEGEMVCIFNTAGFLEVGICKGKAENLLGLRIDSPVLVIADN
jgi:S-adenosylmethionine hydrolase